MKKILFCIILLNFITTKAQDQFEKGFFIGNDGNKIECLIKNLDWKNNPNEFMYKLNENESSFSTESINNVKEFKIYDKDYYKRFNVKIDRSSNQIENLSWESNPVFRQEVLFLKVLIEGKATLYSYEDGNLNRYFFEKDNSGNAEQFIYKQYKNSEGLVYKNMAYQNQLSANFKIENLSDSYFQNIRYYKSDFVKYFIKYNEDNKYEYKSYIVKRSKNLFNLNIRPGFINSNTNYSEYYSRYSFDFEKKSNFRLGIEAEILLPFNNNKWAIIIEPTYKKFDGEYVSNDAPNKLLFKIDYKSIELPIGVRYYVFLNDKSKLFFNGAFAVDFNLNSTFEVENSMGNKVNFLDFKSGVNFFFGMGYKFNDTYSLEIRSSTERDLFSNYHNISSKYKSFSVIFGYTIF